jgi:hypothetical protein
MRSYAVRPAQAYGAIKMKKTCADRRADHDTTSIFPCGRQATIAGGFQAVLVRCLVPRPVICRHGLNIDRIEVSKMLGQR